MHPYDWLQKSDKVISRKLRETYRRYGIKFQSAKVFQRVGWGASPAPRIEKIYAKGKLNRKISFVWDLREALLKDDALFLTSILLWRKLKKYKTSYLCTIETSGILLLAGILMINQLMGDQQLSGFYLRKKVKRHGLRRLAEGSRVSNNKNVIIVDDLLNSGKTKKKVIEFCRRNRLTIKALLVAIDTRSAGERMFKNICPVEYVFSKQEILKKGSQPKINIRQLAYSRTGPRQISSQRNRLNFHIPLFLSA